MNKKIEKYISQAENFSSDVQVERWQERVATFLHNSHLPGESGNFTKLQLGSNRWDDLSRQLGFLEALGDRLESIKTTKTTDKISKISKIIAELKDFKANVSFYYNHSFDTHGEDTTAVREKITKNSTKIKRYLIDVNVPTTMVGRAAPVAGGFPFKCDLIEDMFQNEGGPYAVQPKMVIDTLNKAIGIYEDALESGELPSNAANDLLKKGKKEPYVDNSRIKQLTEIGNTRFDLIKLIQILNEINICYAAHCYYAVVMLVRALMDHIPPIFECSNFSEVTNNYRGGQSFKKNMQHLEKSCRNIADQHLHYQIRKKETLPNDMQINFSNDIDVLLSEIVRILKK